MTLAVYKSSHELRYPKCVSGTVVKYRAPALAAPSPKPQKPGAQACVMHWYYTEFALAKRVLHAVVGSVSCRWILWRASCSGLNLLFPLVEQDELAMVEAIIFYMD